MSRVKLPKGEQKDFLEKIKEKTGLSWISLSQTCSVCARTLRDWKREKYQMNYEIMLKLHKFSKVPIPKNLEILPEYWSNKKAGKAGAKRRYEIYGNPGTPEGRRKGGISTMRRLRSDSKFAKMTALRFRKQIRYPEKSSLLAEFTGVLLGDGGIRGNHQVTISYNTETDRKYATYVQGLINKLFRISSSIYPDKKYKGAEIVVSSTNLVEFLAKKNILQKGNKIFNKIDVPKWIMKNKDYKISCLRGLMDTDGGIYYHKYRINGKWYKYSRLSFRSSSPPLVNSVVKILRILNFTPKVNRDKITLYRLPEIERYFRQIGTHNPKHLDRYYGFNSKKSTLLRLRNRAPQLKR